MYLSKNDGFDWKAVQPWVFLGKFPTFFLFSSTNVYHIPDVLGTGNTKIKLDVAPEKTDN